MGRGNHFHIPTRTKFVHEPIDRGCFDQRFVSLNIDDVAEVFRLRGDFSDAVGSALVFRRSERHLSAPFERSLGDAHVVGRNDDGIERPGALATFPDMAKEGFTGDLMQRLSRKSG